MRTELGEFKAKRCRRAPRGAAVDVLLRPDDIVHDDASPLRAEVLPRHFAARSSCIPCSSPPAGRVLSLVPTHHNHAIGEKIGIRLAIDHVVAFPVDG